MSMLVYYLDYCYPWYKYICLHAIYDSYIPDCSIIFRRPIWPGPRGRPIWPTLVGVLPHSHGEVRDTNLAWVRPVVRPRVQISRSLWPNLSRHMDALPGLKWRWRDNVSTHIWSIVAMPSALQPILNHIHQFWTPFMPLLYHVQLLALKLTCIPRSSCRVAATKILGLMCEVTVELHPNRQRIFISVTTPYDVSFLPQGNTITQSWPYTWKAKSA